MEPHASIDPATLVQHTRWLRALAASLTADRSAADDVVQDAWLAALRKPPREDQPLAPWLATVVKNLAWKRRRGESRRALHESLARAPSESARPEETLARLEITRRLVEAIASLEEPLRTTLVLRYFEERSSAEIARLSGVPAGTVRWRLKRGLDELRERLDARYGGSRESWLAALVPLARIAPSASVPTAVSTTVVATEGVLVMGGLKLVGLAAVVILVALVWWAKTSDRAASEHPAASSVAGKVGAGSPEAVEASLPSAAPRAEERATASAAPALASTEVGPAAAPELRTARIDARFVDASGAPWSGVLLAPRESKWGSGATSDADGRAEGFDVTFPREFRHRREGKRVLLDEAALELVARRAGCAIIGLETTVHVGGVAHLGDVVLVPAVRITGRVSDEHGRAIEGATVGLAPAVLPPDDEDRRHRHGSPLFDEIVSTRSERDGGFVLDGVAPGSWRVWGKAEEMRYRWTEAFDVGRDRDTVGIEIALQPFLPTDRIAGQVVDPDGQPVHASLFYLVHEGEYGYGTAAGVDEQGHFDFLVDRDGAYDLEASVTDERYSSVKVEHVRPGTLDLTIRLERTRSIDVALVDASGRPIEGGQFEIDSRTISSDAKVEVLSAGRYRVPVPAQEFHLKSSAPKFRSETRGPFLSTALPAELEIVMRPAPSVRGRVVADGAPVRGARVVVLEDMSDSGALVNGFECVVMMDFPAGRTASDAEGRFALDVDVDGPFWIRAEGDGWVAAELGPLDPTKLRVASESGDDFELALTHGGAIEGHVLLPGGQSGEGAIVAVNHGDGTARTMRAGPGGLFRFDGLVPGRWQVLLRDAEVDPDTTSYSSAHRTEPIAWSCDVTAGRTTRFDLDRTGK